MMNVQTILDRIDRDAKAAADAIQLDAEERARLLKENTDASIAKQREKAQKAAAEQAVERTRHLKTMASLEMRKEELAEKRALLDEAFSLALAKMNAMSDADARAHGIQMLQAVASGDEVVIASEMSAWCDADFVRSANEALIAASKQGKITLGNERRALPSGGFILKQGGMEVQCTYQALLDATRLTMEADVAKLLFE